MASKSRSRPPPAHRMQGGAKARGAIPARAPRFKDGSHMVQIWFKYGPVTRLHDGWIATVHEQAASVALLPVGVEVEDGGESAVRDGRRDVAVPHLHTAPSVGALAHG